MNKVIERSLIVIRCKDRILILMCKLSVHCVHLPVDVVFPTFSILQAPIYATLKGVRLPIRSLQRPLLLDLALFELIELIWLNRFASLESTEVSEATLKRFEKRRLKLRFNGGRFRGVAILVSCKLFGGNS